MRLALRRLLRRPATSIVAVLALAAGIGASTALFALVDRILIRPLPYRDATRIVQVWNTFPQWRGEPALDAQWDRIGLSWEELQIVRQQARSINGVGAAYFREMQAAAGTGDPEVRVVARGTASLLDVLGVQPAAGRWFRQDEEGPGAPRVIVASWDYWAGRLGADPAAIGRDVRVEGEPFTLIGVLPRDFRFPAVMPPTERLAEAALWQPIGTGRGDFGRFSQNYETVVRLRDGIPLATAEAENRAGCGAVALDIEPIYRSITIRHDISIHSRRPPPWDHDPTTSASPPGPPAPGPAFPSDRVFATVTVIGACSSGATSSSSSSACWPRSPCTGTR
jgi:hypothetical protein